MSVCIVITDLLYFVSDTLPLDDQEICDINNVDALDPEPVRQFAAKADEAGVVVFVLSKAFAESITCKEQVCILFRCIAM